MSDLSNDDLAFEPNVEFETQARILVSADDGTGLGPLHISLGMQVPTVPREEPQIRVVIPCVNYDDFLRLTLPFNIRKLPDITVLTAPDDSATIRLAEELGVPVFATSSWYKEGPLNKGLAINDWLDSLTEREGDWLMTLDADILLPTAWSINTSNLHKKQLYSVRRRMCESYAEFQQYSAGSLALEAFPINVPPVIEGKVWGHRPTSNPAGLSGYFQLWCPKHAVGLRRFPVSGTAAKYDVEFAFSFPEQMRSYIEECEVLHIGPSKVNWSGRQTPRWIPR